MNPVPVSLPFADRSEAGRRLAERVRPFAVNDPLVLALPRGGVPVGAELAERLDADFDVLMVRKIGLPGRPELGVGAIAEDGRVLYDDLALARMHVPRQALSDTVAAERDELDRRRRVYRGERPAPRIAGRDCVVVDDGVATGGTARAALRMIRQAGPAQLVLAVPVASPEAVELLREEADALVVLSAPDNFRAVGEWYREFDQLSDGRVTEILAERAHTRPPPDTARGVRVRAGQVYLDGDLTVPADLHGAVVMASEEGRGDQRWRSVSTVLQRAGYATLVLDLLTGQERSSEGGGSGSGAPEDGGVGTDVLGERLRAAVTWLRRAADAADEPLGVLASGGAAAAALVTAAEQPRDVAAVVVHGGRIDLAGDSLPQVRAPVLVLLEGEDSFVRELGEWARGRMGGPTDLRVMAGAERLLGDSGEWRRVASEALDWFDLHLGRGTG
ncbi:phosphoribosyl transferase [Nocardiopsis sp. TSRI0078]|uniref:phosphoribosyltransferase family protein n=1 Tax=unclassified Nocardiopsis TaxID=2649073 RepID=UPI00093D9600|nr:phosphoribosyltransferase family protein [Nocardiopsis sp. TSRI0078]OKI17164.1 phosphoribosyl transferase [Nocardiopsis sp. TSRI0078]